MKYKVSPFYVAEFLHFLLLTPKYYSVFSLVCSGSVTCSFSKAGMCVSDEPRNFIRKRRNRKPDASTDKHDLDTHLLGVWQLLPSPNSGRIICLFFCLGGNFCRLTKIKANIIKYWNVLVLLSSEDLLRTVFEMRERHSEVRLSKLLSQVLL